MRLSKTQLLLRCRALRVTSTDAEQVLWNLLRNRQVADAKFRRQHAIDPYILDFYCAEVKLAIEVDGGQHLEPAAYDQKRTMDLPAIALLE